MVKILSQAGTSLADTYNVEGSIAGIEQLETRELPIVHEMGGTVFSERLSSSIRHASSGAINQSTNWNVILTDLPVTPFRILGVTVFISTTARVTIASVAVRHPGDDREIPIWIWDAARDVEVRARFTDTGAAVATTQFLRPLELMEAIPHMGLGTEQPQPASEIAFRGQTAGFGAGTVTATMIMHVQFSQVAGLSSRGLPIPSW